MNQDPVRVSQVHWTRVFPFLRLFQAGSLGLGLSALLLAGGCLLVSWTGSVLLSHLVVGQVSDESIGFASPDAGGNPVQQGIAGYWQTRTVFPPPVSGLRTAAVRTFFHGGSAAAAFAGHFVVRSQSLTLAMTLTVWNALVLGLFGTAIARAVATDFCQQSGAGVVASVSYACRHWQSTLLATGLALAFPAGLRGLISLAGLLPELGSGGEWIAAAVWGIIFLLAVILALMFVVGGLAWLLSLAATGTDGCTGAEALSRCISYILSHPLWVAGAFTAITATGLAMRWVAELILAAGTAAMPAALLNLDSVMLTSGWLFVLRMIPHVFQLSVFLSGVTVCYVLLRQREDGIMIEEIDGAV